MPCKKGGLGRESAGVSLEKQPGKHYESCLSRGRLRIRNKRYVLLFVFIGTAFLFVGCSSGQGTNDANANNEQNDETGKAEQRVSTEEADEIELNPFGNTVQKKDMDDHYMLSYIHYMSHQKVRAEHKWGFYEITDERIQWLLDALDEAIYPLDRKEKYREILTRWANGDDSKQVQTPNER